MHSISRNLIILIACLLIGSVVAQAQYTTLDVPGAHKTIALGISGNSIAGWYEDSQFNRHGFLYNGSSYTTLDVPGASDTYASGISGNSIVGYYSDNQNKKHGFLYNGSSYTTLDVPGARHTLPCGISGNSIVGWYEDSQQRDHGFLYNGSSYTTLDVPGASDTYASGISGNNIVGWYVDSQVNIHGFLYNGSSYTTLDIWKYQYFTYTYICGISGNSIVGYVRDDQFRAHGFLYNGSSYTFFDAPFATYTYVYGISGNSIVGWYNNDLFGRGSHGFRYGFLSITALDPTDPTLQKPASTTMRPSVLRFNNFLSDTWRSQVLLKITGPSSTTLRVYVTNPQQQGPGTDDGHNHVTGRVHGWLYAYKAGDTKWKNYPAIPVKTQEGTTAYSDYDSAGVPGAGPPSNGVVTTDKDGIAYVYYTAPSISGEETVTVSTVDPDPTNRQTADLPLILQMPDFSALSESDTIHLIGSDTPVGKLHPNSHNGTATMNQALQALALNYKAATGAKLPVNDMSLPWGGLFDLDADWDSNSGHVGHRRGIEADLGLTTGNAAFERILGEQGWWDTNPSLWKSEGTHYHILQNRRGTPYIVFPGTVNAVWQNKSQGLLNVTLPLLNRGGIDAASLMFTAFTFTNGVTLVTPAALPAAAPGLPIQSPSTYSLTVKVPANVKTFRFSPSGYATVAGSAPYNVNIPLMTYVAVKVP